MKEIMISKNNKGTTIALLENGVLIEKYEDTENKNYLEEKIYLGIVKDILPGMQAAFIDIGEEKNTFIHLKDLLPKIDITKKEEKNDKTISEVIKQGDKILVQVKRDATNIKGAKVSTHISLANRFTVLMPETDIITASQKIENEEEKKRLIDIVKNIIPRNYGAIIRTSSIGKDEKELRQDLEESIRKWKKIKEKADMATKVPILIDSGNSFIKKMIIDLIDKDITKIIINSEEYVNEIKEILSNIDLKEKIKLEFKNKEEILKIYNTDDQIEKTKSRKVHLKCGGFITIDKTEALTAIDVNSGRYTGKRDVEETILKVNKEATIEIAKQLRLRDIGGVIIIDYIDMNLEKNKKEIEELLKEELKKDRSKTQVIGFSKLDLLEMTRKHIRGEG
ncbi:MAG: Rne/Rng family ribonuclease [Clostridia bacterium]|nr:Rne/Rng family ribonuclease [Clostridia bacterium]